VAPRQYWAMLQEPFEWSVQVGDSLTLTDIELTEFMEHVVAAASRDYRAGGHEMGSTGTALDVSATRYRLNRPAVDIPDLLLLRQHDVATFVALGRGSEDAFLWEAPLAEARARLGSSTQQYEWTAIIGALPDDLNRGQALAQEAEIGGLRLVPFAEPFFEFDPVPADAYSLLSTGSPSYSWPIGVAGIAEGYAWHGSADRNAAHFLHALCTLLTLIWNAPWAVRQAARPREICDVLAPDFEVGPGPAAGLLDLDELAKTERELPSEVAVAWEALSADRRLADATTMFSEGVGLSKAHPSFALIAFVSAIESTAQISKGAERCETCNQIKGSTQRFRSAVATVLDDDEADLLATAYAQRSGTAHRAKLHGAEQTRGSPLFPIAFGPDDTVTFQWTTLRLARRAARRLVLGALGLAEVAG
jgi:hypothetical protein